MKQFQLPVCIFPLVLLNVLLLSCNSGSETSTGISPASTETATVNPSDSLGSRDPYYVEQSEDNGKQERKAQLVKKYDNLLVFHADDTMEVNRVYTATLALARNAALEPIKAKVLKESEATDDKVLIDSTIALGKRVKATLEDWSPSSEPSFNIKELGNDEQNLSKTKESLWQWRIEPLKEGQHKLKLSIQVTSPDDGEVNLPLRNIPIIIFAKKVSFLTKVGNFFSNYWQWVITGILLPIIIAFLTNWIRKK
jgi:hypothetical protein